MAVRIRRHSGAATRRALVEKFAKATSRLEDSNYTQLRLDVAAARRQWEDLKAEARRVAKRRDDAKRTLTDLIAACDQAEPKFTRAQAAVARTLEQAIDARCGDMTRLPRKYHAVIELLRGEQERRDLEKQVHSANAQIAACNSFKDAMDLLGANFSTTVPPEREREWREAHPQRRLALIAAWGASVLGRSRTPLQAAIIAAGTER